MLVMIFLFYLFVMVLRKQKPFSLLGLCAWYNFLPSCVFSWLFLVNQIRFPFFFILILTKQKVKKILISNVKFNKQNEKKGGYWFEVGTKWLVNSIALLSLVSFQRKGPSIPNQPHQPSSLCTK